MSLSESDVREINWNPKLDKEDIEWVRDAEFTDYANRHKDHSCLSIESAEQELLKKQKDRTYPIAQLEFTGLKIWDEVLNTYNSEMNLGIHSPTPYCHDENEGIVMELINGENWAPFDDISPSGQSNQVLESRDEAKSVCRRIGQLAKIMENEGLSHGDIAQRHVLVNQNTQEVGLIDLEGVYRADSAQEIEDEVTALRDRVLKRLEKVKGYESSQVDEWYSEGYSSIPDESLSELVHKRGFQGGLPEEIGESIDYVFN